MPFADTPETLDIFVSWGGAVLILFALISGVTGFAVWLGKRFDKRMTLIAEQLDKRTQPIQSGYENDGNSLTDISKRVSLVVDRQTSIGKELLDLRTYNEAAHEQLTHKVETIANRLDDHAASPAHDRRVDRTRKSDTEE